VKKRDRSIWTSSDVLESKAFFALTVHGIRVLMIFYTKRKLKEHHHKKRSSWWEIINNGELVFTYKEAVNKWDMSRKQFVHALDDLIAKGFLEITYQGTGPGDPSTYKLCERWQAFGTEHFKSAPERRKNVSKKMGWYIYNERKNKTK
jgi:hypothetical protein